MFKHWIAAVPVIAAATVASAQESARLPVARFTERDDGRVIRLPVGAEMTVSLPEQGGTAYRWTLRDSDNIRQIGAPTVENVAPPGVVGGTSLRTFRLQIVAGGRTPLKFSLRSAIPGGDRQSERHFDLTVDADTMRHIPTDYGSDDRQLITVTDRDAYNIVSTKLGRPIEIHLPTKKAGGYHWEVLSSRNIAFERPVGVEYKPGILGFGAGPETVIRLHTIVLHTIVDRSDGFLELVYMPPGQRASRSPAIRRLSYQFHNQR